MAGGKYDKLADFYPRPPRGGRPAQLARASAAEAISIHALREEGDNRSEAFRRSATRFLSTPSARRATQAGPVPLPDGEISIHALREEGD